MCALVVSFLLLEIGYEKIPDEEMLADFHHFYVPETFLFVTAGISATLGAFQLNRIIINCQINESASKIEQLIFHFAFMALYIPAAIWTITNRMEARSRDKEPSADEDLKHTKAFAAAVINHLLDTIPKGTFDVSFNFLDVHNIRGWDWRPVSDTWLWVSL